MNKNVKRSQDYSQTSLENCKTEPENNKTHIKCLKQNKKMYFFSSLSFVLLLKVFFFFTTENTLYNPIFLAINMLRQNIHLINKRVQY